MASFNKVILLGNLTRDPERSYTPKGTAMTKFGLAVNYTYTTESGEKKEEANFFDIVVWGRQAETAAQYLSKGRPVLVEGRLRYESWQNDKGEKRSKIGIVAEKIQFLGGGQRAQSAEFTEEAGENSGAAPAPRPSRPAAKSAAAPPAGAEEDAPAKEKDDIPF